ncbi:MAG: MucR family transcriptional regulator [Rickettsiales bacterium]|jgi:predicted transcriptional regulator|nr:MucR family transcriptional regulator [Rickettsiales bacterium]
MTNRPKDQKTKRPTDQMTPDLTAAIAALAAAAMNNNPALTLDDAVAAARESLHRGAVRMPTLAEIKNSVRSDKIMCFEDGSWHTMMRRYLRRKFNLSPDGYRAKWGLPADYPFVAPNYAKTRSRIAKKSGLGHGKKRI